jgi:alpha-tubulin suppressor-like RCC1 family protein
MFDLSSNGDDAGVPLPASFSPIVQVSVGWTDTCAIRTDGRLSCWGSEFGGTSSHPHPSGQYTQVSTGRYHACAIRSDGETVCWGDNAYGQLDVPDERFTTLSAGTYHTCGMREDGSLRCWGAEAIGKSLAKFPIQGQSRAPDIRAIEISAGVTVTCALLDGGSVQCWGLDVTGTCAEDGASGRPCPHWDDSGPLAAPAGVSFEHISVDEFNACGVTTDHELRCWGSNASGESDPPDDGTFEQVSGRCALSQAGTASCWGTPELRAPKDHFVSISARDYACGVTAKHVMQCWGSGEPGLSRPPGSQP